MAPISETVRPLKCDTLIAAIPSSISASRLVPATSARIAFAQSGSGIQTQQEAWIGRHLGFVDHGRQIRLIGWGEEQAIEAVFPFFQQRRAEHLSLHPREEGGHQGLQAFGMLLEQPVEELVAGDHS
jgi:hypothetical protein